MKDRTVPCAECRKSRRKCIPTLQSKCKRCQTLEKKCTYDIVYGEEEKEEEKDNAIVEELQSQATELELAIRKMETQLRLVSCGRNHYPNIQIQNLAYKWKVQIENGTFKIETGIKNISDLTGFLFNSNTISYLSPFKTSQMIFQFSHKSQCNLLIPFTLKVLVNNSKKKKLNGLKEEESNLPNGIKLNTLVTLIDEMVEIYFNCHNSYTPILHKSSFMNKYKQLDNPENDLLSLSICANVCSSPCDHIKFISTEQRKLSDYFFNKAKMIILDQFDLHEKRLENVMSINLLSKYMHLTLKYNECHNLITIAYQICLDLSRNINLEDELSQMLYSRHVTITIYTNKFMNYLSKDVKFDSFFRLPNWKYMEDESEEIKQFSKGQNWLLDLSNHPFIVNFLQEVHRVYLGYECKLSFESLVQIENVISEWIKQAPDGFRLCEDLNDVDLCIKAIDSTTDSLLLMSFIHYQAFVVSIYSSLLQPTTLEKDLDQLLSHVQQKFLELSLKAGQLLIYGFSRISTLAEETSLCYYKLAASDFLFHAINVLLLLSISTNNRIARESRITLKKCLDDVIKVKFMQEQFTPISGTIDFSDESSFDIKKYEGYTQPWFAMVYDVSYYIASL